MSGTERGEVREQIARIINADYVICCGECRDATWQDRLPIVDAVLAAALAEHEAEGCAGCARVEALAAAREARAEVAALRTEREEAVRLLRNWQDFVRDAPSLYPDTLRFTIARIGVDTRAFLARTDTGGQEP